LAWDCGAGHYFEFLIRRHLVLNIFLFLVSTAKLLGDFCNNGEALRIANCALPILSFFFCCANTIGASIRIPPIGEAQLT
jgi:hypothetical protein